MRIWLIITILVLCEGCYQRPEPHSFLEEPSSQPMQNKIVASEPTPIPTPEYPGKSIDQIFPPHQIISGLHDKEDEKIKSLEIEGFTLKVSEFVPLSLEKNGLPVYKYDKRQREGYWGLITGVSHLRGSGAKEIYSIVSGPGGVCCTNYSIVDISDNKPRTIFHSEDFGSFRDQMEVFDTDGDGVYELMQWDSCFRYFMDDCGSCSPEPRVYFKYENKHQRYLPAIGLTQDFVRKSLDETEKNLEEKLAELNKTYDPETALNHRRSVLSLFVDLVHIGEEKKAWNILATHKEDDAKTRTAIQERLANCPFYQFIKAKK